MDSNTITLGELFAGHLTRLNQGILWAQEGLSTHNLAEVIVKPVLADLEQNAGQEMDPLYVAYLIVHASAHQ